MEEKENNQQPQQNESNIARRERLLGTDMTDKIHDEEAEITKGSFFANLWYNHKWKIIIASAFLLVAIIGLVQIIGKQKEDMKLQYFGRLYVDNELYANIIEALDPLVPDYNQDEKKEINFTSVCYRSDILDIPENKDLLQANAKNLDVMNHQIYGGYISFYIMDKNVFDMYKGNFITAEEILGYKPNEEMLYESRAVLLEETMLDERYPALAPICKDTVICVQKIYITNEQDLERAKALFKAIVELE